MKAILIQAIFILFSISVVFSQVETFEDEAFGSTSFMVEGFDFTFTGDLRIEIIPDFGCDNSERYLGTVVGNGGSSGSVGSIKVLHAGDKFKVSTESSWCTFVSEDDGHHSASGDVIFIGSLSNGETIEETFFVKPLNMTDYYGQVTFSSEIWEDQALTELAISIGSNLNYLSIDNIVFKELLVTSIDDIQEEVVRLYPNLAVDEVEVIGIDALEAKIIDAFGRIVSEQALTYQKIDISGLSNGIYYIAIETPDQQIIKRIIKY